MEGGLGTTMGIPLYDLVLVASCLKIFIELQGPLSVIKEIMLSK
jgi:hypothetical protein